MRERLELKERLYQAVPSKLLYVIVAAGGACQELSLNRVVFLLNVNLLADGRAEFRLYLLVQRGIVLDIAPQAPHQLCQELWVVGEVVKNPESAGVKNGQHGGLVPAKVALQVFQQVFLDGTLVIVRCVDQVQKDHDH